MTTPSTPKQIFTPGLHERIPAEIYHAAEGISNSDLKIFGGDSPLHYYNAKRLGLPEDDSELDDDEREARKLGTLVHTAVLEGLRFGEGRSHYVKPTHYDDEKTGEAKKWNGNAGVCKLWVEQHQDLPVISAKEERRIIGCRDAIRSHPVAGPLLKHRGANETSVFATHPRTGLTLRCRPDRLTEDAHGAPWAADIKTCPSVRKFVNSARDFRYDVQSVFYADVLAIAGVPDVQFCFIAVELKPRYGIHAVRVVMLEPETAQAARELYEAELDRLADCQRTGVWPLNNMEIEMVRVKRWL